MKKTTMLTSKRTYQRNLQTKIGEIRKAENIALSAVMTSNCRGHTDGRSSLACNAHPSFGSMFIQTTNADQISSTDSDCSMLSQNGAETVNEVDEEHSNILREPNNHDQGVDMGDDYELAEIAELAQRSEFGFDVFAYIKTLDFELRKWAIKNNISLVALSELLGILKKRGHPSLPKDARTLLKTPKKVDVIDMGSGQYWYGGLRKKLVESCKRIKNGSNILELRIHIDGTPIYKSSKSEFWPIQCSVKGIKRKSFFVALYKGRSKPYSAEEFLRPLIDELHELMESGLTPSINGENWLIEIEMFILDAPARAFLKCIIGHGGYFACERCEEEGKYLYKIGRNVKPTKNKKTKGGHVCLIGTNAPLRTDESFRNQVNEEHHHFDSPLEELPIDMVRDIPLEYLHLVLYGAMKRLLTLWIDGTSYFKFSDADISKVSKIHIQAGDSKPSEINRSNRSLNCLSFWKATELRTFLLKTGPVALQGSLTEEMYNHFLALHCAVTICCSKPLINYLSVARSLFRSFTERFGEIYGDENYTYCIHSLIHAPDDVERFGVFDEYSAFPGESNLGFLKNLVRGGHLPLQQVVKRIVERDLCEKICELEEKQNCQREALDKNILRLDGLRLDSSEKNRWILTKSNEIFKIDQILQRGNVIEIRGAMILKENLQNLYALPIESKSLFIYKSKLQETVSTITLNDMFCKLYRIDIDGEYSAFMPLLHYTQ